MKISLRFLLTLLTLLSIFEQNKNNVSISQEKFNLTSYIIFECNNSINDCSNHGECLEDKTDCKCFHGFSTYFLNYTEHFNQSPRCNYKMKKQLNALIIACFMSFGIVHFYLENNYIGFFQLFLFTFIFFTNSFLIIRLSLKHLKNHTSNALSASILQVILIIFLSFVFILWYIFDIIMIVLNMYRDTSNQEIAIIL